MAMKSSSNAQDLEQILKIDSELNTIHDLDILLERILLETRQVVNADAGTIYVRENDKLLFKYSQNDTLQAKLPAGQKLIYNAFSIPIDEKTISGYAALTGNIVNIKDAYNLPAGVPFSYGRAYDERSGYKSTSMLSIPLKTADGNLLGVIQVINAKDDKGNIAEFSQNDEYLVGHFAANAVVALQRARMSRAITLRMIKMSELRDPKETGPHVNRVAGYASELYEHWAFKHKVPQDEVRRYLDTLRYAAMLHDVGKVAISDIILKKPGRFTDEEFRIMQGHTWQGALLFTEPASDFDRMAAEVALTHHQNWDGSGYPDRKTIVGTGLMKINPDGKPGLSGEEIPLAGRITALADVFDALVSRRVYKDSWETNAAIEEIRSLGGIKFDPEIVEIFFDILPSIKQIHSNFPDKD
jgi:HD-GYP domain-containing protein (c-di-GMP phosphodiesterase class II)